MSLIVLLEIVLKFLFWQALPPLKFVSTSPEQHEPFLNREILEHYTIELEELGFVQLMDYTSPSMQGMARLFAHPKELCFVEIGQVKTVPMFCSISSDLQNNWTLAVTNLPFQTLSSAIRYAFFRQPKTLVQHFDNASASFLLASLISWRQEVSEELGINPIADMTAETYLEKERSKRIQTRHFLLSQSITLGLLRMGWFSLNPTAEWLGDYPKFKTQ